MSDDYRENLAGFISEYVDVKKGHRHSEDEVIEAAICMLIEKDVFTPKEMQRQALKDYSIIIPKHFIDKCIKFG